VRNPGTDGKVERVMQTLMEMWHKKTPFDPSLYHMTEWKQFLS